MQHRFKIACVIGIAAMTSLGVGCIDFFSDPNNWSQDPITTGTGGTGGGPSCDGDPTQDPDVVTGDCGVFVKAGATDGDGTKEKPFGSFADASKLKPTWVFACAGDYAEAENVVFEGDIAVYGGFTGCGAAWKWSADARAKITGLADTIAVTFDGGTSHMENVDVTAADAKADGGSSIAVLVKGGAVEIVNGDLTSGAAMPGAVGESLPDDVMLNGIPVPTERALAMQEIIPDQWARRRPARMATRQWLGTAGAVAHWAVAAWPGMGRMAARQTPRR